MSKGSTNVSSSFTLVVEASTAEELKQKAQELLGCFATGGVDSTPDIASPADDDSGEGNEEEKEATPKKRRKPKEEAVPEEHPIAPEEESADEEGEDPFAEDEKEAKVSTKITADDVKAELQKVVDAKGMPTAKRIVASLGVKKLSAIEPKDYEKFMSLCKKELSAK